MKTTLSGAAVIVGLVLAVLSGTSISAQEKDKQDKYTLQVPGGLAGTVDLDPVRREVEIEHLTAPVPRPGEQRHPLERGAAHASAARAGQLA